jgi:signal transduction histidine kinase
MLTCRFKVGKGNYEYALPFHGERRPILIDLVLQPHEEVEARYDSIERKESMLAGEAYMPALKGGALCLFGTASILRDSMGNIVGAIESIRDITERKQAEEELGSYRDHLEELVRERTAELTRTNEKLTHDYGLTKRLYKYAIAERHGGKAWVEPRTQKGTTFYISISKTL